MEHRWGVLGSTPPEGGGSSEAIQPLLLWLFVVISMHKTHHCKHFHVASGTFTVLYNQHLCLVAERFRHPSRSRCSPWWSPRILCPSPCTVALDLLLLDVSHARN